MGSGSRLPTAPASSNTTTIQCRQCSSQRVWKDGIRYTPFGEIQRYLCRNCAYRFSHSESSEPSEHHQRLHTLILKTKADKTILCRVSATQPKGAKNLVEVESRTQEKAAGATSSSEADIKGKIVEFAWHLKKEGYRESTIITWTHILKALMKQGCKI